MPMNRASYHGSGKQRTPRAPGPAVPVGGGKKKPTKKPATKLPHYPGGGAMRPVGMADTRRPRG